MYEEEVNFVRPAGVGPWPAGTHGPWPSVSISSFGRWPKLN